jgi:HSP20 family protein
MEECAMSMTRWNPWGEMVSLRDAMDRLLSDSYIRPHGEVESATRGSLAVDVREEGDQFIVTAPVAGVSPNDVEISVLGDAIRIRGERREERQEEDEGKRWLVREQRYGAFERVVRLPSTVKADNAEASFKDGILTIMLPKSEEAKERRIPIRGSQGAGQTEDVVVDTSASESGETPSAVAGGTGGQSSAEGASQHETGSS